MHGNARPGDEVLAAHGVRHLDFIAHKFVEYVVSLRAHRHREARDIERIGARWGSRQAHLLHVVEVVRTRLGGGVQGAGVGCRVEHQRLVGTAVGGGE